MWNHGDSLWKKQRKVISATFYVAQVISQSLVLVGALWSTQQTVAGLQRRHGSLPPSCRQLPAEEEQLRGEGDINPMSYIKRNTIGVKERWNAPKMNDNRLIKNNGRLNDK